MWLVGQEVMSEARPWARPYPERPGTVNTNVD
jgi:hypothetical protein